MHAYDKLKAKWDSLYAAMDLFGASMAKVCGFLAYECPYYLEKDKKFWLHNTHMKYYNNIKLTFEMEGLHEADLYYCKQ